MKNKFDVIYESIIKQSVIAESEMNSGEEFVEEYDYQGNFPRFKVQIVKLLDEGGYGFNVYLYDKNNNLGDMAIFESASAYDEIESVEKAKEFAEEWINDYVEEYHQN
jgi:hypothetical protein